MNANKWLIIYAFLIFLFGPFCVIKIVKKGLKNKWQIFLLLIIGTIAAISALFALVIVYNS